MTTICPARPSILHFEPTTNDHPRTEGSPPDHRHYTHPRGKVYLKPIDSVLTASSSCFGTDNYPSSSNLHSTPREHSERLSKKMSKNFNVLDFMENSSQYKSQPILRNGKSGGKKAKEEKRVDGKGVEILRGGKKHTVTFKPKIHNVLFVENWKEFNVDTMQRTSCAKCQIF